MKYLRVVMDFAASLEEYGTATEEAAAIRELLADHQTMKDALYFIVHECDERDARIRPAAMNALEKVNRIR